MKRLVLHLLLDSAESDSVLIPAKLLLDILILLISVSSIVSLWQTVLCASK